METATFRREDGSRVETVPVTSGRHRPPTVKRSLTVRRGQQFQPAKTLPRNAASETNGEVDVTDSRYCGNCETDGATQNVDGRLAECTVCGHQTETEQDDDLPRWAKSEAADALADAEVSFEWKPDDFHAVVDSMADVIKEAWVQGWTTAQVADD